MKTLGLIGGTSWVSTIDYYRYINQLANEKLGGLNFAQILLYSISFNDVKSLADVSDWQKLGEMLSGIAQNLENAGADDDGQGRPPPPPRRDRCAQRRPVRRRAAPRHPRPDHAL